MTNENKIDFEKQTFTNKFMFAKVMEDKKRCKRLLECLLGCPIGELSDVVSERQMMQTEDGKMIRLDIYTQDEESMFDVEMQNQNNHSVESLQLPKRSRFYQSEIDVDFLQKGNPYRELPENNVIFICTFDPFGRGKPLYEYENRSNENPPEPLNDGCRIYFFNCTYEGTGIPEELKHFYEFVRTETAGDALTEDLKQAVEEKRMNYIYRSDYLRQREMLEDARAYGKEEGIEEGRAEERAKTEEAERRIEELEEKVKHLQEELKKLKSENA